GPVRAPTRVGRRGFASGNLRGSGKSAGWRELDCPILTGGRGRGGPTAGKNYKPAVARPAQTAQPLTPVSAAGIAIGRRPPRRGARRRPRPPAPGWSWRPGPSCPVL